MRAVLLALVALLALPSAIAEEGLVVRSLNPESDVNAGDQVTVTFTIQRACPVSGVTRLTSTIVPPLPLKVYPYENLTWKAQKCQGYSRAEEYATVFVTPRTDAASGPYEGEFTVTPPDGESVVTPFTVRIPYTATVGFQGPKTTEMAAGASLTQPFNVTVTSNGPANVALSVEAPSGWSAQAADSVSTTRVGTVQRLAWPVTVVAPPDASGTHRFVFTAVASSASGGDAVEPVTYDWFVRIPLQSEQLDPEDVRPPQAEDGTPVWLIGVGLILGAGVALWWARR